MARVLDDLRGTTGEGRESGAKASLGQGSLLVLQPPRPHVTFMASVAEAAASAGALPGRRASSASASSSASPARRVPPDVQLLGPDQPRRHGLGTDILPSETGLRSYPLSGLQLPDFTVTFDRGLGLPLGIKFTERGAAGLSVFAEPGPGHGWGFEADFGARAKPGSVTHARAGPGLGPGPGRGTARVGMVLAAPLIDASPDALGDAEAIHSATSSVLQQQQVARRGGVGARKHLSPSSPMGAHAMQAAMQGTGEGTSPRKGYNRPRTASSRSREQQGQGHGPGGGVGGRGSFIAGGSRGSHEDRGGMQMPHLPLGPGALSTGGSGSAGGGVRGTMKHHDRFASFASDRSFD